MFVTAASTTSASHAMRQAPGARQQALFVLWTQGQTQIWYTGSQSKVVFNKIQKIRPSKLRSGSGYMRARSPCLNIEHHEKERQLPSLAAYTIVPIRSVSRGILQLFCGRIPGMVALKLANSSDKTYTTSLVTEKRCQELLLSGSSPQRIRLRRASLDPIDHCASSFKPVGLCQ
jgi:hypothetical protein